MTTLNLNYQDRTALDATHRAASFARGGDTAVKVFGSEGVLQASMIANAIIDALTRNNGFPVDPGEFKRGFDACANLIACKGVETESKDSVSRSNSTSAESVYPEFVDWYGGA